MENFFDMEDRMARLGLHRQLWSDARDLPDLGPLLETVKVPTIVDHLGRMQIRHGVDHPGL